MTELSGEYTTDQSSIPPPKAEFLSLSDRTKQVDRCMHLLANRRCRFCLYYLHLAPTPVPISDLSALIEEAVTPPEEPLGDRILDEAERRLLTTHLPKLQDVGLVQVRFGYVELASNSSFPIREWLSLTAQVELER